MALRMGYPRRMRAAAAAAAVIGLAAVAMAALGLVACHQTPPRAAEPTSPEDAATAAIQDFHREFDAENYASIWSKADADFRRTVPRAEYVAYMTRLHRELGGVVRTDNLRASMTDRDASATVLMAQNTRFEHGLGLETFTFRVTADGALLLGYNLQSNALGNP